MQELRNQFEARRANGDGHRHGEGADQGQRRMLDQHADAELAVEGDVIEPPQHADVAACLLPLLDAAEGHVGLPARLDRIQVPLTDEPGRLHLDVELHLLVHLGIELRRPGYSSPQGGNPRQQSRHYAPYSPNLTRSRG